MSSKAPQPHLVNVFYIDPQHSRKHAHMIHWHEDVLELLYIADGTGRYLVGEREYAVHDGMLIVCNAGTLHGESPFQSHEMTTYCLAFAGVRRGDLPPNVFLAPETSPILVPTDGNRALLHELMRTLHRLFRRDARADALCAALAAAAFSLVEHLAEQSQANPQAQKQETLVRRIASYLNLHYMKPLTLKGISAALHISETHLSHLFKRETGLSPMQYVIHRRIGEAQSLLSETDLRIGEIEEQLGFGSSTHFTNLFKKYVGLAPREYRKYFRERNNSIQDN